MTSSSSGRGQVRSVNRSAAARSASTSAASCSTSGISTSSSPRIPSQAWAACGVSSASLSTSVPPTSPICAISVCGRAVVVDEQHPLAVPHVHRAPSPHRAVRAGRMPRRHRLRCGQNLHRLLQHGVAGGPTRSSAARAATPDGDGFVEARPATSRHSTSSGSRSVIPAPDHASPRQPLAHTSAARTSVSSRHRVRACRSTRSGNRTGPGERRTGFLPPRNVRRPRLFGTPSSLAEQHAARSE